MSSRDQAKQLAEAYLDAGARPYYLKMYDTELVIIDDLTITKDWGWVFQWNTKEFAQSRDDDEGIIGNGPIVVLKTDNSIHQLRTSDSVEVEVKRFEREVVRNEAAKRR